MLYIDAVPPKLQEFLKAATVAASVPQREWLIPVILAMAAAMTRRNVKSLAALLHPDRSRSALNDFFTESPWPAPEILRSATLAALAKMALSPGEEIYVILDGTQKAKRGSKMDGLGFVREAGSKEWRKGHRILLCYLLVRGVLLPWAVDLYLSKKFLSSPAGKDLCERLPEVRFQTINEMAANTIRSLPADWRDNFRVTVLLDSGFCNPTACGAVRECGFHYVVAAQSSRNLVQTTRRGKKGRRVKLKTYAPGRIRYQGRDVLLPSKRPGGKPRRFRIAEQVGAPKGLGVVKMVFSRRQSDGSVLSLACSDTQADARAIALAYGWRWEIEVTTKGLKQRLGLGQYQCRYYEGMVHHLHLSLLAHVLLNVAELERTRYRLDRKRVAPQLPSMAVLQTRLRQDLWRSLLEGLRTKRTDPEVIARFERALAAAS